MRQRGWQTALFFLITLALACSAQAGDEPAPPAATPTGSGEPRSFHLGFTPFPYDLGPEAIQFVYDKLASDADITAHHFDNGVPWPEALSGEPYDQHILDDWTYRRDHTPAGHQVYVAITPINWTRDSLAAYRGSQDNMPLPAPWDGYAFDSEEVKGAYLNYAVDVVEFFDPDYLAIGIESNLLAVKQPELWPSYSALHQYVYEELKSIYPDLPIFVSVLGTALLDGYQQEVDPAQQLQMLEEIMPFSDYFGISMYPYLTSYLATEVPDTLWTDLFALSEKPVAVTETGYAAEPFDIAAGITVEGSPEKQAAYIQRLLQEADDHNFVFVINFVLRDYDALYESLDEEFEDIGILWRDTGLYDGDGAGRPALEIWRAALARPYESVP